ncbi:arginine--tRNA ligase [Pseudodesulfovibrio thermohalotolerans]|uniref:arginine--tRNA ligase n=1 Tax=Pseudodesulfovibrio thermohalotolerans TaxID=2880651 RepID=UPI0022B9DCED|nr:arginine--tRNA ligase [Pseudodesulfovibrio thermohalotolerans]WFS62922.1 arginine--tRNA ligase [Pseudodesulfovibrio thermohalotolerans]
MRAKIHLEGALKKALDGFGWSWPDKAVIEPPKDSGFGDMSANVAMMLAREAKKAPRAIAEDLKGALESDPFIEKVEIAGPGFLNFTLTPAFWQETVGEILGQGGNYGSSTLGNGTKVQVEYVSANPTGPLHIGHGRGAALGDSLTRILEKAGYDVEAEYYINDAGRQMLILGGSILYRARQLGGLNPAEPEDYYKGEYITDIARDLMNERPDLLDLPEAEALETCKVYGKDVILEGIKQDLAAFGVRHDVWFSEKSLVEDGKVDETFADLTASGMGYEADGAYWFKSTELGDDKDRVLRKTNGDTTYFASDIAYHDNKFKRGFDLVVDIWGADHHGYVPRMMAACEALGKPGGLYVILVNLVNLLRDGQPIAMSTRAGQFETLKDVVDEVGSDAARFMFLSRKSDSKLDFDLELVKQKSMDNPVYYVQYAHARICSLNRKAAEAGVETAVVSPASLALLNTEYDLEMLRMLDQYPDYVESAARTQSPHLIATYLQDLASKLHRYYTNCHVLSAEPEVASARLMLLGCVAGVVADGLALLGVNAPESM